MLFTLSNFRERRVAKLWTGGQINSIFLSAHHLKASQRIVSEGSCQEDLVLLHEIPDLDVVIQDDGLLLDEGQLGHFEQHPGHVVRIGTNLKMKKEYVSKHSS